MTGELEAHLARLDPAQVLRFRRALVEAAQALLRPHAQSDDERLALTRADEWLAEPTDAMAQRVLVAAQAEHFDGGVRYHDYHPVFLEPVNVLAAGTAQATAAAYLAAVDAVVSYLAKGKPAPGAREAARESALQLVAARAGEAARVP